MPKTEAERKVVSGWSKDLEQIEIERFLTMLADDVLLHAEFDLTKKVDFDANA
jgi:hypothetical protein